MTLSVSGMDPDLSTFHTSEEVLRVVRSTVSVCAEISRCFCKIKEILVLFFLLVNPTSFTKLYPITT